MKRLKEKGLVSEEAVDGRESRLSLTQRGAEQVEKDISPVMEAEHAALAALDEKHQRAIVDALGSYVAELKNAFIESGLIDNRR